MTAVLTLCAGISSAQTSVSPYSMFGIGVPDFGSHGASSGMAGLGIGLRQDNTLNTANPASLSAISSKTFIMDVAVSGSGSMFSGQGKSTMSGTANLDRVGIGFRIGSFITAGAGIEPFSKVEYKIQKSSFIEGSSDKYTTRFTGDGGLHKVYLSFAFEVARGLSVGMTGSIIMGTVTHTETSDYWTTVNESRSNVTPYLSFGAQYHRQFGRYNSLTVGVTGSYRKRLSLHNSYTVSDNSDTTTVADKVTPTDRQCIPAYYGAGISWSSRTLTIGADWQTQKWSAVSSGSGAISYKDMNRFTAGLSWTPNPYDVRRYWKRITFLFGVSADDSYLKVNGVSGINWTVTAGMRFPVRTATSFYWSLGFKRSTWPLNNRNTVRENILSMTVGVSFGESWFVRKRFE